MTEEMQGHFSDVAPDLPIDEEGLATEQLDPLALDIPDEELGEVFDKLLQESIDYYTYSHDLYARRDKNELYYLGKQIEDMEKQKLLKEYDSKFSDNVLYEIEGTIKPLAMSRLPDLIVTPGHDSEQSRIMADEVSKAIDTQVKSRQNRRVLGVAFKHLPVYFTGIIKARWDNELDDYVFESVHPSMVEVDHTSPTNNADDMRWIRQIVPWSVQEVIMRFPKKKEEFIAEVKKRNGIAIKDENDYEGLATVVKISEIWFHDYREIGENKVERVEGVMWKYFDVILGKMRNPNYDYTGSDEYFEYDTAGGKTKLSAEKAIAILAMDEMPANVKSEKVYHNYFDRPKKPFYFMGYDQWGLMPYDITSRLEQNIKNQKSVDKRGQQIEETLNQRGHNVFSKMGGLKPSDIQQLDLNNPDTDILVDGNVNDVHKFIAPARPDAAEFKDLDDIRNRMYAIAHANAVRGQIQTDVATTNQIARESDFTAADDLVEDTVNAAAEWMACWALQFIKLRYTVNHWRKLLGMAGDVVFLKLNQNMIEDGMEVMIKASGTDKLKAQNNALDEAKIEMIDPVNFFRDMGHKDYEQRAAMLIAFMGLKAGDPTYELKYVKSLDSAGAIADALMEADTEAQPPANAQPGTPAPAPAQAQAQTPAAAFNQPAPQQPTPTNTSAIPEVPQAPAGSVQ